MYKETISDRFVQEALEIELEQDLFSFKECERAYKNAVCQGKESVDQ